jgi:hypothetical protein
MAFPIHARMIALSQRPSVNITELAKEPPAALAVHGTGGRRFAMANAARHDGSRHMVMAVILLVCRFWREA